MHHHTPHTATNPSDRPQFDPRKIEDLETTIDRLLERGRDLTAKYYEALTRRRQGQWAIQTHTLKAEINQIEEQLPLLLSELQHRNM